MKKVAASSAASSGYLSFDLLTGAALLAAVYALTAAVSIATTRLVDGIAVVWISNAVAAIWILRSHPRATGILLAAVAAACLVVNLAFGHDAPFLLSIVTGNVVEVAAAVWLVRRRIGLALGSQTGISDFLTVAASLAVLSPLVGGLVVAGLAQPVLGWDPLRTFWTWWTGSASGATAAVPPLLLISRADLVQLARPRDALRLVAAAAVTLGFVALAAAFSPFPFILVTLPLMTAAAILPPAQMAILCTAVAAFLIGGGITGLIRGIGEPSQAFHSGLHLAAAITVILPLCGSMLIQRLRRERRTLAESEERFRRAFEESAIGVSLSYLDGRVIRVNQAFCTMLGRSAEDLLESNYNDFTHPDDVAHDRSCVQAALAEGRSTFRFEKRYLKNDRQTLWVRITGSVIRDEVTGEPLYQVAQIEDIDQQKRAEAELARVQNRWTFALESAGQGVWDADFEADRTYYSPVWKAMLGYADHEIGDDGFNWLSLMHPDDRERAVALNQAHIAGLTPMFECEFRMRHKAGHWVWVLDRGRVIARDGGGRPLRMIGTHTDISRQKENEEKLAVLADRIRVAVEAGGVGLWEYDVEADRLVWDDRMHALYGTAPDAFTGSYGDWEGCIHPDDRTAARRDFDRAIDLEVPYNTVFRIVRPSGDVRHIRALARLHRSPEGGVRLIGTNWDVTEQRLIAEALADEKERLRVTLHSIGDAVISTDVQGRITFMNLAAESLTGFIEPMVMGAPIETVYRPIHEDTGEVLPSSVTEALAAGAAVEQQHPGKLVRADGTARSIRDTAAPVRTANGEIIGAVLVFQDVTNARALQRDLAFAASHDALTGLKNRAAFEGAVSAAHRTIAEDGEQHALLFIDLDRFKILNDTAGHAAGDSLLREIATVIRGCVRGRDLVGRLGGDEFAVLLHHCRIEDAEAVGDKIIAAIKAVHFAWNGKIYAVGASIGLTAITDQSVSVADILAQADVACYAAKSSGRDRVSVYHPERSDAHRHLADLRIAAGIREGIEQERFHLYAQEIRALATPLQRGRKLEILTRMVAPDGTVVPPGAFIPAAERFDLMSALDRWVLRSVVRDHGRRIVSVPDLTVAVNLSANSLSDPLLWDYLEEEMAASAFDPSRLVLEITETAVINNFAAAERFVDAARGAGCRVSLDDFGSGVSSFNYLKRFQVDSIKIDGAFVRNMVESRYDRTIVRLIHEVGTELGIDTVAEFVEDTVTVDLLREIGVTYGQGYLFHRPRPLDEVLDEYGAVKAAAPVGELLRA